MADTLLMKCFHNVEVSSQNILFSKENLMDQNKSLKYKANGLLNKVKFHF
jgi:hypothetical protein